LYIDFAFVASLETQTIKHPSFPLFFIYIFNGRHRNTNQPGGFTALFHDVYQ